MRPTPTLVVPITRGTRAISGEGLRDPIVHASDPSEADRRARLAALALLVILVGFCVYVEFRVATSQKRRIDLDVVLRAAWAVRTGENPYSVANERGWHYNLPPLLAILLVPLAEPPPEEPPPGTVPILVSLALWNVVGLLALIAGIHVLACAIEQRSLDPTSRTRRFGCWQWWAVRLLPVVACLPAIGISLNRGQVNLFLAALLCAGVAAALRGRRFAAGLWLAGAVCLKIIPAFLLLYPLWTRDRRWLAGTTLGLVVGLGVIPVMVFGPARATEYYRDLVHAVLLPGLSLGGDQSRAAELINLRASNSQSFQVLVHNLWDPMGTSRHSLASSTLRIVHWLLAGALTLVTLRVGSQEPDSPHRMVIRFGALTMLMVPVSPASHDHYFCVNVLLVMGLVAAAINDESVRLRGRGLAWLLIGYAAACVLPVIPDLRILRHLRLPLIGSLALWLAGILTLRGRSSSDGALIRW